MWTAMAEEVDVDEVLRKELETARHCFLENKKNKFCILCRKRNREDVALSHIIPHSVLKSSGMDIHSISPSGKEVGHSNLGYRGYCKACERMLSVEGEQRFNPAIHEPLVSDFNSAVRIEERGDIASIYHCAFSIWWRLQSLAELACQKSDEGNKLRKLLEVVRQWLHQPNHYMPEGLVVFFSALHSENLAELECIGLDVVATRLYGSVDGQDGRINVVFLGPLRCHFRYCTVTRVFKTCLKIAEGDEREYLNKDFIITYMKSICENMYNAEIRARGKSLEAAPSEPMKVPKPDIIPSQVAILYCDTVTLSSFYRQIGNEQTCQTSAGNVQLVLCTAKKKDDPPYDAVATINYNSRRIRIWLRSDHSGKRFEMHEGAKKLAPHHLDSAELRGVNDIIAKLILE